MMLSNADLNIELNSLNALLKNIFADKQNYISADILDFLSAKSKKLRPVLIFLFSKALKIPIDDKVYSLAAAVETVHNASLVHDDIIDNAKLRRNKVSLNYKLGSNLSVLAGDIMLAAALKLLSECRNSEIIQLFASCLYNMCKGEIMQNSFKGKILSMEDYIKKSQYKTAELFKAALVSLCILKNIPQKSNLEDFALNFGAAFQLRDDLINITGKDNSKPSFSDIKNGIYTAPVIYLSEDEDIIGMPEDKIISLAGNVKYAEKTRALIKQYERKAVHAIDFIEDNEYKREIIKLAESTGSGGSNK